MIRTIIITFVLAVIAVFAVLFYHYNAMNDWLNSPKDDKAAKSTLDIPHGMTVRGALRKLAENGLIEPSFYIGYVGFVGETVKGIQMGEYEFSSSQSPLEMLKILEEGKIKLHTFTVTPGFDMGYIDALLIQHGFYPATGKRAAPWGMEFSKSLGLEYLEGYLFPDTYSIPKGYTLSQILRMMVDNFYKHFNNEIKKAAKKLGITEKETIIIASIIEKESGSTKEFRLVSSVIHNRLKKGMRLQMDTTVIYGMAFQGNLTRKDLETDHPWNTYTRNGLPSTPICNPSAAALRAAVNPVKTSYLYFVSMNNSSHKFSKTLAEHNKAVYKYQILRHIGP